MKKIVFFLSAIFGFSALPASASTYVVGVTNAKVVSDNSSWDMALYVDSTPIADGEFAGSGWLRIYGQTISIVGGILAYDSNSAGRTMQVLRLYATPSSNALGINDFFLQHEIITGLTGWPRDPNSPGVYPDGHQNDIASWSSTFSNISYSIGAVSYENGASDAIRFEMTLAPVPLPAAGVLFPGALLALTAIRKARGTRAGC